ncbi:hypothetical protein [Aeromonas schubertii]|uniref:hypothetical protein n=1 Tax=Aeromonas schubertii TaxID=652 RepID=UPI00128EEBF0|nr:hypothetical protein [Aeromonas schubertii]
MKKTIAIAASFIGALSFNSYAGTGVIPSYHIWDGGGKSCFKVSNISSNSAIVTIKMFDKTGEYFSGTVASNYIIPALDTPFTLEARKTAFFCMTSGEKNAPGYGIIEGQPLDASQGQISLVASGYYTNNAQNYAQAFSIVINGGMPF